jgi:hypothetical protein
MRLAWLTAAVSLLVAPAVAVAAPSFSASIDRPAAAPDQPFLYIVTLANAQGRAEGFKGPDFRGFKVLGGPQIQQQSGMNFVIGAGGIQAAESQVNWIYKLVVPAGTRGPVSIGAAHVRAQGMDLTSNSVMVRIGAAAPAAPPAAPRAQPPPGLFPRRMGGPNEDREQQASAAGGPFLRATADKKRAYVGEQVTVTWSLFVPSPPHFQMTVAPRADGFWTEEIPSTNPSGELTWTQEVEAGQPYQVGIMQQRALFPLAPGKPIVTPMEVDVVLRVDIFQRPIEVFHVKSQPLTIEAIPLPREGQPDAFPAANVGQFTFDVAVDRGDVAVGDAVTLTMTVRGNGNVRNVALPDFPSIDGWKSYEPRTNVVMEGGVTASGTKAVEMLIRPERPGKTTIPSLTLISFDPATRRYVETKSRPIEMQVRGEATAAAAGQPTAAAAPPGRVENVIGAQIRPIRARTAPSRSIGAAVLQGGFFIKILLTPPLALALMAFVGRVRDRLSRDERRTSRRRMRSIARRRLSAAAAHRDAGRASAFYVEIERVLRETLSEKLRVPVAGLRSDELAGLLSARGLPADEVTRLLAVLAACDEARFSPGGEPAERPAQDAMLERAAALIDVVEKAPLAFGGAA